MVQVPLLDQKTVETRALPAPVLGNSIRPVSDPYVAQTGMTELAKAVKGAADQFKDRGDQVALMDAQRRLDDWEARNLFDPNTGYLAKRGKDAFDGPQQLGTQWDQDMREINDGLGNADQQLAFQKMAQSRRDNIMRTVYGHERQQMDAYADATAGAAKESAINRAALNYNNDQVVESSIQNAKAVAVADGKRKGLPEDAIINDLLDTESKARLGVLGRLADNDAKAAVDYFKKHQMGFTGQDLLSAQRIIAPTERKYKATGIAQKVLANSTPKIDQDGVINYVMNDLEGGDKLITDGNGALAKYGINAAWNKDLFENGATPTEEQARQRYKDKYWKEIDADNLPPDMRLAAFAFAVNAGSKPANDIIAQSGNDPRKMIELQAKFYQDLATKNPDKYAGQLDGWMNRLGKVSAQIDLMHGSLPDISQLYTKIDGETDDVQVASEAKEMVNKQIEAVKNSQKNAWDSANQEAWRYKQNGMEVPPSVVSRMKPQDAAEMQKSAPPDPQVYESARQSILAGVPVDLGAMRWRLGSKYDDLVELQGDTGKVSNARTVDDVIKNSSQILLGKANPKTPDDFNKIELFRRAVDNDIQALQKTMKRPATGDEVQKITDKLLLKVKTDRGLFGSTVRNFELKPGEQFTIGGIVPSGTYLVAGQSVSQAQVLDVIIKNLNAQNIPVNNESVDSAYKKLLSSGQLQYTYDKR